MINKRLIKEMKKAFQYVIYIIVLRIIALFANIGIIISISIFIGEVIAQQAVIADFWLLLIQVITMLIIRAFCQQYVTRFAHASAADVKITLRLQVYQKLQQLGERASSYLKSAELIQLASDGIEQLELYFASYLPQFFYALLAPLILFVVVSFIDIKIALVLLLCVPLIPISIVVVMKIAKKILQKYWGMYLNLGGRFLDNLQGLTTLKIFNFDEVAHAEMNDDALKFRDATMKVLVMQLNSITIMDIVAYGGAALAIILTAFAFGSGTLTTTQSLIIILISAEFFLPMRALGSVFHTAMNGVSASDRMFKFLDIEMKIFEQEPLLEQHIKTINLEAVRVEYQDEESLPQVVLSDVSMTFDAPGVHAIVGESGSGKSTVAKVLMNWLPLTNGRAMMNDQDMKVLQETDFYQTIHLIPTQGYLFDDTIRANLLLGNPQASTADLYAVLEKVKLRDFVEALPEKLDYRLKENGKNVSGGQRQRLVLARALLHDSPVYIFDEATSSVDAETETLIMEILYQLAETKLIILISHRLANVAAAKQIFVLEKGKVIETGRHQELIKQNGWYHNAYREQQVVETLQAGGEGHEKA